MRPGVISYQRGEPNEVALFEVKHSRSRSFESISQQTSQSAASNWIRCKRHYLASRLSPPPLRPGFSCPLHGSSSPDSPATKATLDCLAMEARCRAAITAVARNKKRFKVIRTC